ncbi:MAG: cell division protein ZapA [Alcanivoracaceae bacterium]|jgi:cell division protein ZapA|nr:cell division protein ZapA [Alcanivoracaceae bacterium]
MSDQSSVVVHLLDKEYRVGCSPEERDELLQAARFLDDKMREVKEANVIGLERIAVMAALNISHELLQANNTLKDRTDSSARVSTLLNKVEAEIRAVQKQQDEQGLA